MHTRIAVGTFASPLPGSRSSLSPVEHPKRSVYDRLDKVFVVAEHVDARCVHLLDSAAHRRRENLGAEARD